MTFMTWTDEFSVGVNAFDDEHKELIDNINEFYDGVSAGVTREALIRFLDALIEHTVAHFAHEEMYFDGYPQAERHKYWHEHLKQQALEYRSEIDRMDSTRILEMLGTLKEWLAIHIVKSDKEFCAFLNTKGIAVRQAPVP